MPDDTIDTIWIQLTREQITELKALGAGNRRHFRSKAWSQLIRAAEAELKRVNTPAQEDLVHQAIDLYGLEGERREITIDLDAAISPADNHDCVMAWVMVPHDNEEGDPDAEDPPTQADGGSTDSGRHFG